MGRDLAKAARERLTAVGTKTAYIEPGSRSENGYVESFNARLRDELLDGEIFYTLREAQIVIESWRRHSTRSAHKSLGYDHRHPRCSCKHSPRGRLRHVNRLRRPTLPLAQQQTLNSTFPPDHSVGADRHPRHDGGGRGRSAPPGSGDPGQVRGQIHDLLVRRGRRQGFASSKHRTRRQQRTVTARRTARSRRRSSRSISPRSRRSSAASAILG